MKTERGDNSAAIPPRELNCELLILADGTVLAKNLTEKMAAILTRVAPDDNLLGGRAVRHRRSCH